MSFFEDFTSAYDEAVEDESSSFDDDAAGDGGPSGTLNPWEEPNTGAPPSEVWPGGDSAGVEPGAGWKALRQQYQAAGLGAGGRAASEPRRLGLSALSWEDLIAAQQLAEWVNAGAPEGSVPPFLRPLFTRAEEPAPEIDLPTQLPALRAYPGIGRDSGSGTGTNSAYGGQTAGQRFIPPGLTYYHYSGAAERAQPKADHLRPSNPSKRGARPQQREEEGFGGDEKDLLKGWIHAQYGIRTEGEFSLPELQSLDRQLGAWSHALGKERFKELLAAGAAYNYPNDMFAFRREDSLDTGWVDSEGRVRINRETFDPGGRYRNFGDFVQDSGELPNVVIGHEIAHIIRDGMVRAGNTDLTTQYAARLGREPLHHDTDPNENLATGLALYVLAQAGLVHPQPNPEYDNVLRFIATVAIPALKHANRNRRPEPHGVIE